MLTYLQLWPDALSTIAVAGIADYPETACGTMVTVPHRAATRAVCTPAANAVSPSQGFNNILILVPCEAAEAHGAVRYLPCRAYVTWPPAVRGTRHAIHDGVLCCSDQWCLLLLLTCRQPAGGSTLTGGAP